MAQHYFGGINQKENQFFMEMQFRSETEREAYEFQSFLQVMLYSGRF